MQIAKFQSVETTTVRNADGSLLKFAGVALTPETIQRTREHFAENQHACARLSLQYGECGPLQKRGFYVNEREEYILRCEREAVAFLAGEYDCTFTFAQRAYFLQTSESVPMFSS